MNELHCTKLINFSILRKAFGFYLSANSAKRHQNPFVDKLIKEVFNNKRNYYALDKIETLRYHLKRNKSKIQHTDFGAGSQFKTKEKTIASFVNSSASDKYKGKVLFNLARHFQPQNILELGTNIGLGAAFLASANKSSSVESLEGCPQLSNTAEKILDSIHIKNVSLTTGRFSDTLEQTCRDLKSIDLAFIDGDHSYQASIDNYQIIKPYLHSKSVVVFDDIYWSDGMIKAWNEIKNDKDVVLSIDVFRLGVLFYEGDGDGAVKLRPF